VRVLVVNAGSSSLKLAVVDGGSTVAARTVDRWTGEHDAVTGLLEESGPVDAVGHRVVHGGARAGPARVDAALLAELDALTGLAPLHQPRALDGIRSTGRLLPEVPAVACFDTSFHAGLPAAAATWALPRGWNRRWGLRRYGFHGLSHAWAARRGAQLAGREPAGLRVVTCHLGAGASLCAQRDGRSLDTTMGFTPLDGLVMATRPGTLDPGLLLWLLQSGGVPVEELADVLAHGSGLAGLSGTSGDLRDVEAAAAAGQADAALALEVFAHRLARETAAMTVAAGGLDLLVLTGGIGEHAPQVRAGLADRLAHLGVALDDRANHAARGDADVSAAGVAVRTVVVTAREDLQVAQETAGLLEGRDVGPAPGVPSGPAADGRAGSAWRRRQDRAGGAR
jgi:acetate kinase